MGGAFTVMWLLRDIRYGEEVTRDFVRPGTTPIKREVILCAYGLESSLPEELPVVSNLKPRPWYQEWARIIGETTTGNGLFWENPVSVFIYSNNLEFTLVINYKSL